MSRYLFASDAGGTMTDVIIVDEEGNFVIGKGPTTPHDESIGYMESLAEAFTYLGKTMEKDGREVCGSCETAIYTGTAMLNTTINRNGQKTGLLVTRGFEDVIVQGRGRQTFIGFDWSEITHMQYRKHGEPLIPRRLTRGVTERIDMFGRPVIPLYEHEVRQAVQELMEEGIQSLAIVFLYSFINGAHEQRAKEIASEIFTKAGREVYLAVSSEVAPVQREISRANATVIQAYATEPARRQFLTVEKKLADQGYERSLKTVLCYGGVTNIRYPRLFETMMSGPVGGLMGAHYLGEHLGIDNIVCSDMGGTSFDAGCITAGILPIDREPPFMQMYVNVPMLDIQSIGAGTGTYIRVDPQSNRIKLGPDSAGGNPGPTFQETGNTTPTICDCDMLLGILNPDNYLGGRVPVNMEVALSLFEEKVARPLKLDPYVAAEQCVDLVNVLMREHLVRSLMLGYDIRDYVLLGYGGAGPMHLLGYAADYPWKGIATAPHAAAFSAWGGACMDYAHRRHKSISAMIPPGAGDDAKMQGAKLISGAWSGLENDLLNELLAEGFTRDQITLRQIAYVRYYGQLEDVEVESPVARLESPQDVDALIARFEEIFGKMFTLAGKPPQPSYLATEVSVIAQVATIKPRVLKYDLEDKKPAKKALKGKRPIFQKGRWVDADIYEMDELRPGNEFTGLAVVEASNTTLFVPEGWRVKIDPYKVYWMDKGGKS
jgi:N-methylhydantoinase A/oxoprolinase/acetone carboxylase beta subunit